jgi:uncharacterized membrane protein YdjX (TVP38/TMEM64 family)
MSISHPPEDPSVSSSGGRSRVGLVLGGLVAVYVLARLLGLEEFFHAERVREVVADAGAFGPLAFLALFVGAVVAQVPGVVFVLVAPALFPWSEAWLLCWAASNLAVLANFELVRRVGGQPLQPLMEKSEHPWLRKLFAGLEARPIRTIALLRVITIMFPPVTGALALTQVSARDHAIGSALGMAPPITLILALAGWFIG